MRRLLFLAPLLVFLLLALYFVLGLRRDPALLPSAMIDHPAPDFSLPGIGDQPGLAKSDLTGGVSLVNFFASWCVPCREEHPVLMRLAAEKRIRLYGIAYKDKTEKITSFLTDFGSPYERVGLDEPGRVFIDFGAYGVPETYIVDAAGKIRYRHVGPLTQSDFEQEIVPRLKALGAW